MSHKQMVLICCAAYLGVLWILASVPLAVVLFDYQGIDLKACGTTLGWFAAALYGSLFIYPTVIGGLAMAALLLPLATTVLLIEKSRSAALSLVGFYIVATIAVAALEFGASPRAVFEIDPELLRKHPTFLADLDTACANASTASKPFKGYQAELEKMLMAGGSYTRWAYHLGFVASALMQNALFVVFLAFIVYRKQQIVRTAPYLKNVIFYALGYALFLGSLWCLFRLTYINDMQSLFGESGGFGGGHFIVGLYALVLVVFVVYFEFGLEKLAKTLANLGQFVVFALGVAAVQTKHASFVFGHRVGIGTVLALFVLFAFTTAIVVAFFARRD
jgi:hypothetical protein